MNAISPSGSGPLGLEDANEISALVAQLNEVEVRLRADDFYARRGRKNLQKRYQSLRARYGQVQREFASADLEQCLCDLAKALVECQSVKVKSFTSAVRAGFHRRRVGRLREIIEMKRRGLTLPPREDIT